MERIQSARLVWIFGLAHKNIKLADNVDNNDFISMIDTGDRSEYLPAYYEQIKRRELLADHIDINGTIIKLVVVESEYTTYKCNLIHIYAEINCQQGICHQDFARLINGSAILNQDLLEAQSGLKEKLVQAGAIIQGSAFLINQVRETIPPLPKDISVDSSTFIKQNIALISQFLLRSNTDARYISPDNHLDFLVNTSSFKGSVDLCSACTMIQFYFSDLESLASSRTITADTRFSWMCSVITMVNIQSMILKNALVSIDTMGKFNANQKISRTKELKNILVDLREYWDVDAMIHPMTARKVDIYKKRMGVTKLFETLTFRMESTENLALRELSEIQNEQDQMLNYILLLIASVQIVPLVYQMVKKIGNHGYDMDFANYGTTMFISIFLPLLILKVKNIRRRFSTIFRKLTIYGRAL